MRSESDRRKGARMKKIKKALCKYAGDIALIAGAALVVFGAWQICHPAGVIVAGAALIAGSVLESLGGGDDA